MRADSSPQLLCASGGPAPKGLDSLWKCRRGLSPTLQDLGWASVESSPSPKGLYCFVFQQKDSVLKHSASLGDYKTAVTSLAIQSYSSGFIVMLAPCPVLLGKRITDAAQTSPCPSPPPTFLPGLGNMSRSGCSFICFPFFSHAHVSLNHSYMDR